MARLRPDDRLKILLESFVDLAFVEMVAEASVALYEELLRITSSPVVALNHAASRADLLRRFHRFDESRVAYERALSLTTNHVEQNYIRRRLELVKSFQPQKST